MRRSSSIINYLQLIATVLMFSTPVLVANAQSKATLSRVDAYVIAKMHTDTIPGAAIAVIKKGVVVYKKCFGYANLEDKTLVNTRSYFQLASLTKQFTATATLVLAEKGLIDLNRTVGDYLQQAPASWRTIHITHLLDHSSGLVNYENMPGFPDSAALQRSHKEIVSKVLSYLFTQPLRFSPGERSEYCNSNYFILGAILEKVGGKGYEEILKKEVLDPLQMEHTFVNNYSAILKGRVAGYTTEKRQVVNADHYQMSWFFAEGYLLSTLDDLTKWVIAFEGHELLLPRTIKKMTTPERMTNGTQGKFGYGWFVDEQRPSLLYHSGHNPGFSSFVQHDQISGVSVILLLNNDNQPTPVLRKMAQLIEKQFE